MRNYIWRKTNPNAAIAEIDGGVLAVIMPQGFSAWTAVVRGTDATVSESGFITEVEARAWCERKAAETMPPPPPAADPSHSSLTWHATPRGTVEASKPTERGPYVFKVAKVRAGSWSATVTSHHQCTEVTKWGLTSEADAKAWCEKMTVVEVLP